MTPSAAADGSPSVPSNNNMAPGGTRFPMKLHVLLESTEKSNHSHIISWLPDGTSFKVHDKHRFTSEVLPVFFGTSKYKSFQRNLNLWGFFTVSKGPCKGECSHPLFKKGLPQLCRSMERVAVKGVGPKRPSEHNLQGDPTAPGAPVPSEISTSLTSPQAARRASTASEPGRLADFLRQQGGKTAPVVGGMPGGTQHPQTAAAVSANNVAAGAQPNHLQLAMLQRLQGNMLNNHNLDLARLLGLHYTQHATQPAGAAAATVGMQQQLLAAGGGPHAAGVAAAGPAAPGAAAAGGGVSPEQLLASPNLAALLQMYPPRQPQADHAAAVAARNSAMANEAAIMKLLGVSAISRV